MEKTVIFFNFFKFFKTSESQMASNHTYMLAIYVLSHTVFTERKNIERCPSENFSKKLIF